MYSVILHDERLSGNTPSWADSTGFTVEEADPIEKVLGWVAACRLHGGPITDLAIMCHGYVSAQNDRGGHGLELSQDGVYQSNISKWRMIRGMVKMIFVYACNAADVDTTVSASEGNGRQLCLQMAAMTGAVVFAAEETQYYHRSIKPWKWREIDFGDWEGPVYVFRPDGTVTTPAAYFYGGLK